MRGPLYWFIQKTLQEINFSIQILSYKPLDSCSEIKGLNKTWDLCFKKHTCEGPLIPVLKGNQR